MRDIALIMLLAAVAPLTLRFAFVGIYLWAWLALMNPHQMVYGFAQNQPFNLVVAILTIVTWAFSTHRKDFKISAFAVIAAVFAVWISLTTLLAPVPEMTNPLWSRNIKTMLYLFMIMALITNRIRIQGLVWIFIISLGYFGVRGAGFMILTGGNFIVFGPANSMITDNNSVALALIMTLPLMNYLRGQTQSRLLKLALMGAMVLTTGSIIGSYSRGAFVALAAMLGYLWLKSRARLVTGAIAVAALAIALIMMPQKYFDRIGTLNNVSQDSSFQGRLDAWNVAWHVAKDRVFGAGFDGPRQPEVWNNYLPDAQARASHSIYFMVLGEHGFIGLALYLALCLAAWLNLMRVQKLTRSRPELLWARDLASALQVGIVGFLVGGAALPMAYYDGFLTLLAVGVCLRHVVERALSPATVQTQVMKAEPATLSAAAAR
jgi:putative inorganic carbon (HCO3(-)) transporter